MVGFGGLVEPEVVRRGVGGVEVGRPGPAGAGLELGEQVAQNPDVAPSDAAVGDDVAPLDPLAQGGGLEADEPRGVSGGEEAAAGLVFSGHRLPPAACALRQGIASIGAHPSCQVVAVDFLRTKVC